MKWTGAKLPPGVGASSKTRKDGTVVWYFYHKPTKTKLFSEPGSPAMVREVQRAERAPEKIEEQTLGDLCDLFEKSPEHNSVSPEKRKASEVCLKAIRARWGNYRNGALSDKRFRGELFDWRDEMRLTPGKADAWIRTAQKLLGWAYNRSKIDYNHSVNIGALSPVKPRDGKGVTAEQEAAILAVAEPHERQLYLMAVYTCIRQSDLCRIDRAHFGDDRCLVWLHSKTAKKTKATSFLSFDLVPQYAALLDELPVNGPHLLSSKNGNRWGAKNIFLVWRDLKIKAGLGDADIHFHDLRREGINRYLRAGCTDAEAASVSGHSIGGGTGSAFGAYADRCRELSDAAFRKMASYLNPTAGVENILKFRSGK